MSEYIKASEGLVKGPSPGPSYLHASNLTHTCLATYSSETTNAGTSERVDPITAHSSILAGGRCTVVNVRFTGVADKTSNAATTEGVDSIIAARPSILAGGRCTVVNVCFTGVSGEATGAVATVGVVVARSSILAGVDGTVERHRTATLLLVEMITYYGHEQRVSIAHVHMHICSTMLHVRTPKCTPVYICMQSTHHTCMHILHTHTHTHTHMHEYVQLRAV